ncbi:S-adenosyl-L-methionine-dependent methyltransferase [Lojkania enalia]|uniref:S-adenosyl-L-methionine-dependent methyltransferase n=1 Tax=Lojkania enalia TaxID=147567 RepID=A0A9P4NCS0_9PLEO|nr:S-adenosyl-L-methionine-dependent methyltransferase [Didymosphaeria enalia]
MAPYIHGHHASVLRSHEWRTVENSCPHLLPYLTNPSLKILDVGCGPGTITTDLASRVPEGFVYAIDPSAEVIKKARKHAADKGVTNVRFEVGDIFHWQELEGVEEGEFDVVHAHQVLQHLQDPVGAMKEMKRIAKPGGIIAVRDADYSAMNWYPEVPGMREWLDLYIALAKRINCDPNIGKRLHAVAMEAGCDRGNIEASVGTWTFSTPEERAFWCGLWADRTLQSNFKASALESGYATEEDLHKIVEAWKAMEKKQDGWFAVIHGQIICHVEDRS